MTEFRTLKADEIECRIAMVKQNGFQLLLYKTARTDRQLLTEKFGDLWQNDFKVIDGKMYGGIGVYNPDLKEWVWRWDCGTESNTEAEKGQASDAFKRAGFKWGIGVELYTSPFIWINGDAKQYRNFTVKEITYTENREVKDLTITDSKGTVLFSTKKIANKKKLDGEVPTTKKVDDDLKAKLLSRYEKCLKYTEDKPEAVPSMLEAIASLAAELEQVGCADEAKELRVIMSASN